MLFFLHINHIFLRIRCNQLFNCVLHLWCITKLRCIIQEIHINSLAAYNVCMLIFPFFCPFDVHIYTNRRNSMHTGRINGIIELHSFLYRFNALMVFTHIVKFPTLRNGKCDMDCLWFNYRLFFQFRKHFFF